MYFLEPTIAVVSGPISGGTKASGNGKFYDRKLGFLTCQPRDLQPVSVVTTTTARRMACKKPTEWF